MSYFIQPAFYGSSGPLIVSSVSGSGNRSMDDANKYFLISAGIFIGLLLIYVSHINYCDYRERMRQVENNVPPPAPNTLQVV
jgi:hypothetical protein